MHSSTLDHRTQFFEPCKTIFPLLSFSPRLERIRRVGGGEEGKVEIRRIGRARVKSSRRFELFRGGCFERYWRAQVRAERSAADNEEMEEASRRGDEKRRRRTCSARMSAGDVCPRPADPSTSTSRPRFLREKFQSCSNATPRE